MSQVNIEFLHHRRLGTGMYRVLQNVVVENVCSLFRIEFMAIVYWKVNDDDGEEALPPPRHFDGYY